MLATALAAGIPASCVSPVEGERAVARRRATAEVRHTVRPGETVSTIARRYGVSTRALVRDNDLSDPDHIEVGQRLRIRRAPGPGPLEKVAVPTAARGTGGGRLAWPVRGSVVRRYGVSVLGIEASGIAIAAPSGTPVQAADAGRVVLACERMRGYGKTVVLDHGGSLTSVYGGNSELLVREGQRVGRGEPIARVGSTGRAARSQLEFRVYRWGRPRDPLSTLP
ncbi:MAG: peptidoglycan DD-metalloendopeptidase family protein [Candidatus Brocadiia bacterium]